MPLEFLKFVSARPLPYEVSDARDAQLARQCARTGYLDLAEPAPAEAMRRDVILRVVAVLPEGYRAMELLDGFDKGSGFLDL